MEQVTTLPMLRPPLNSRTCQSIYQQLQLTLVDFGVDITDSEGIGNDVRVLLQMSPERAIVYSGCRYPLICLNSNPQLIHKPLPLDLLV